MSKARDLANFSDVAPDIGRKNLIINGDFAVWQRGTSQSGANGYGSADRWFNYAATHGVTYQQGTDAPDGFAYSLTTSGTPTGDYIVIQAVELPATGNAGQFYSGQTMTLSYYAKSTDATDEIYSLGAFRDGVVTAANQVLVYSMGTERHALSTEWQRFTHTFSIVASPNGTNTCFSVVIRSLGNAAGTISLTGVQLEVGSVATPFEHRSYGEELLACQRYYYAHASGDNDQIGIGHYYTASYFRCGVKFNVTMRTNPSLDYNSGAYYAIYSNTDSDSVDSLAIDNPHNQQVVVYDAGVSGGTVGHGGDLRINNANGYVAFDAEL